MSIFDHPDDVPPVATWRCPHCATLQPESTRCWACERTPTTCATCRYFRRSVIGPVGFCGLDRERALLSGDEVRQCWQAPTDLVDLVSDRPGSGRTSWLTLAERQRGAMGAPTSATRAPHPVAASSGEPLAERTAERAATATAALSMASAPRSDMPHQDRPARRPRPLRAIPIGREDGLIEAPVVPPARTLISETQRRSRARRERQRSADLERLREGLDPPADG